MSDLRSAVAAVLSYLDAHAEGTGYGFARTDDPHDFHPDPDSCSEAEIAAHKAACDAYDRGEYKPSEQHGCVHEGNAIICYAPWGVGTYVYRDPQFVEAAEFLRGVMTSEGFGDPDE